MFYKHYTMIKKQISISPYIYPGLKVTPHERRRLKAKLKLFKFKLSKEEVMSIIAEECEVTPAQIICRSREKEIVNARFIFCGIMKIYYNYSLITIGKMIDGRDHTSIMHAVTMFKDRFKQEDAFRDTVLNVYDKIGIDPAHFENIEPNKKVIVQLT